MKPLFRWTIGDVSTLGMEVFLHSLFITPNSLGTDNFRWFVCYNSIEKDKINKIKEIIHKTKHKIELIEQDWKTCPLKKEKISFSKVDGVYVDPATNPHGTLWKICPPRLDKSVHEIIVDNDVVFVKKSETLIEFIQSEKTLVPEDPFSFLGKYREVVPNNIFGLNSGLLGLPPNYDFENEIFNNWKENGMIEDLRGQDEQGLLTSTLIKSSHIIFKKSRFSLIHSSRYYKSNSQPINYRNIDFNKFFDSVEAFHFVETNRMESNHIGWYFYKLKRLNGTN